MQDKPEQSVLTREEIDALPDKVKNYIYALEMQLNKLASRGNDNSDELRRKRYAYWNR
jgi:hypothetical protein